MRNKLFVGNLSYEVTDARLRELFEQHGSVLSAKIICDRSGRSRGYGFVEMASEEDARKTVEVLDRSRLDGRVLVVNEAHFQEGREPVPGSRGPFIPTRNPTGMPGRMTLSRNPKAK